MSQPQAKPHHPTGHAAPSPVLARMMIFCRLEAERIEIWQRTDREGREVPEDRWDPGQRAQRKLYLDLAQLAYLVSMVEPEFKTIVQRMLGKRPGGPKPAAKEATTDVPTDELPPE